MGRSTGIDEDALSGLMKTVARGAILVMIGLVVGHALTFARRVIVMRTLSTSDYGLFSLGMSIVAFAMVVSMLGLVSGTQRFIALYRGKGDPRRVKGVVVAGFAIIAVSTMAAMVVLMACAGPIASLLGNPGLRWVIVVFAALIPISALSGLVVAVFQGLENVIPKAILREIGLGVFTITTVAVAALFWNESLHAIVLAVVLGYALTLVALLVYSSRAFPDSLRGVKPRYEIRKLLLFSLPLMFAGVAGVFMQSIDTVMLGYFDTLEQVGIYNAAVPVYKILAVFLMAFVFIYGPVAARMIGQKKEEELRELYVSVTKWLFIFSLPALLLCFCYPAEIIGLLFGSRYEGAAFALRMLVLGEAIHIVMGPNGATLTAYGRSGIYMMDILGATVINVVLNLVLIPRWGLNGAALATAISLGVLNILVSGEIYFLYDIHPFRTDYVIPVVTALAGSLALYYPLRLLLGVTVWILPLYYFVFLGVSLASVYLTRSFDETDITVYHAIKERLLDSLPESLKPPRP